VRATAPPHAGRETAAFDRGTCGQRRELSDGAEGQGISDDHGAPHLLEQMPEPRESTTPVIPTRTTPRVTSMV
jgi:hypothetical protein